MQVIKLVSLLIDENVGYEDALDVLFGHIKPEEELDVFHHDLNFLEKERKYEIYKKSILEVPQEEEDGDFAVSRSGKEKIHDCADLRSSIYLIIMSSDGFVEAGLKVLQTMTMNPGEEMHPCQMILECCIQKNAYKRYYELLGEWLCRVNMVYCTNFEVCFGQQYSMIHQLNTDQVCNLARFFAHLLAAHALPLTVLSCVRLTEEEINSSSRVFLKLMFQELAEKLGILLLKIRLGQESFDQSIFPEDSLKNTRFSIDFFTSIGLGAITDNLQKIASSFEKKRKEIEESSKLDD